MKKRIITVLLLLAMTFSLVGCGNGEPVKYDAPEDAPYNGLYEVDRMNSTCSYEYSKGVNVFTVIMDWATKDENVDHAEFTDHYYLEWSTDEYAFFQLCQPAADMSALKNKTYTIKPGEKVTVNFDVDSYFEDLPMGYYRFVKILDVKYKDGTSQQVVAAFSFDMS